MKNGERQKIAAIELNEKIEIVAQSENYYAKTDLMESSDDFCNVAEAYSTDSNEDTINASKETKAISCVQIAESNPSLDSSTVNVEDSTHNIALLVEYDGTSFCGWQSQINGNSIQDQLKMAIYELTGEKVKLNGCSRTDAGVHAAGHVSNFLSSTKIPIDKLPIAMNSHLPMEIAVKKARYVADDFHSRFCTTGKQYKYSIWNQATRSALSCNRAYHAPRHMDVNLMRIAADKMIGTKDFASFMASGSIVNSTVRTLFKIEIIDQNPMVDIVFHGDGFLYNMVRILAGTLYYVGIGKISVDDIDFIIESKNRRLAGKTLPAHGLTLEIVFYGQEIFGVEV